jgi:hypothetical protein
LLRPGCNKKKAMDKPHQHAPVPEQAASKIRCVSCPCGHVCLRWHKSLMLHFDRGEVSCALECLRDVLKGNGCGFSLGQGEFSACRAADGFYYLLCQSHVVLRLSEEEAFTLQTELSSARAALEKAAAPAPRHIM